MSAQVEIHGKSYALAGDTRIAVLSKPARAVVTGGPTSDDAVLEITLDRALPWLTNHAAGHVASVSDSDGLVQARSMPGSSIPLVFRRNVVHTNVGGESMMLTVALDDPVFLPLALPRPQSVSDAIDVALTMDQRLLLIVLAEDRLRGGPGHIAPSAEMAARLGWTITRFNRKLDNVCHKLERLGVDGLHGGRSHLASHRRIRLAEWAVNSRAVHVWDLDLLD